MPRTLAELAARVNGVVRGDPAVAISGVANLTHAGPGDITFVAGSRYRKLLTSSKAGAVIVTAADAQLISGNALVVDKPHVAFARIAELFVPYPPRASGVHPSAVIDPGARLGARVSVGAHCTIEAGAELADDVIIGPSCVLGRDVRIGGGTVLEAQITLWHGTQVGQRGLIHSGVVIGADGFGLANDDGVWVKVPQLGRVIVGDDVEIGANTTIDRGALDDTVIEDGVKLDNLIQIGHNVRIGKHTAIAACTAVAGSTKIGNYCAIGGTVGIVGHLEIADRVTITGMSMVTQSITEPGTYSSGTPLEPNAHWHKNYARFKQLDEMWRRIKQLEAELAELKGTR